jgi:hypothetical protein
MRSTSYVLARNAYRWQSFDHVLFILEPTHGVSLMQGPDETVHFSALCHPSAYCDCDVSFGLNTSVPDCW